MQNITAASNFTNPIDKFAIALTCISSTLSIFGAILIFITYCTCRCRGPGKETTRLLLCLTVSDLLVAIGNLAGTVRYLVVYTNHNVTVQCGKKCDIVCIAQSFVSTTASMWSFFWTTTIAVHLCIALIFCRHGSHPWPIKILTHTGCWFIPLGISIFAVSKNALGEDFASGSGAWCWISSCLQTNDRDVWMAVSGKGWELLMYFITCLMFMLLKIYMCKKRRNQVNTLSFNDISARLRDGDEKYLYLWLIVYCLRVWGTARYFLYFYIRATDLMPLDTADTVLLYFQSFGDSAQAFCTCILFCFVDQASRNLLCNKLRCCCRRQNYEELVSLNDTA